MVLCGLISAFKKTEEPATNLFYLVENGITFKGKGEKVFDRGLIIGVGYEAVNNFILRDRVSQNADLTKLCTSLVTGMQNLIYSRTFNQQHNDIYR